jgi:streptomycin 6-kinase
VRELVLPTNLVAAAEREGRQEWLSMLPAIVRELQERWGVAAEDPFQPGGQTAWVAPVRDAVGGELVLKVVWPHPEAADEAEGLRVWAGDGAVRLHAAHELDGAFALLLERCAPGTSLSMLSEPQQDIVVAGLLRRLWRQPEPGATFRPLQELCDLWADESEKKLAAQPSSLDAGLAREGIALFRSLPGSAGIGQHVLLSTDLHAQNVLAAQREPWLVIDPKPYVGDPAYDVLQHMLNCTARLHDDPVALTRRMADLAGLDADRLLLWLFARCVQEVPGRPDLAEVARRIAPLGP